MQLSAIVDRYIAARDVCPEYASLLAARCRELEHFADGRFPLSVDIVNDWLSSLDGLARATLDGYRRNVLAVWRFAADEGLADWPNPRRVKRFRVPAPNVECYTVAEASALVISASGLPGDTVDGIPRRFFWPAIIRMAWDTGLRRSDLWRMRATNVRSDGVVIAVSGKSGQRTFHMPHTSTLIAAARLGGSNGPLLFPWSHHIRTFTSHFADIVEASGVGKGTFRWLRRSSGSYVEAEFPGAGARHLGHSSPATFYRHYDARSISCPAVQPPELTTE